MNPNLAFILLFLLIVHRHKHSPSLCRQALMLGVMNYEEGTCAAGISLINKTSAWLLLWHRVLGIGIGLIETVPLACFLFFGLPAFIPLFSGIWSLSFIFFNIECDHTQLFSPLLTVSGLCFLLPPGIFSSLLCALLLWLSLPFSSTYNPATIFIAFQVFFRFHSI